MFKPDPVEGIARSLVAGVLPAIERTMVAGGMYREAVDEALRLCAPTWRDLYGADIARRAEIILEHIGPAAILTPHGRDLFLADGPLVEIPKCRLRAGNDNPSPPREAIGRRIVQAWLCFWRVPPASKA